MRRNWLICDNNKLYSTSTRNTWNSPSGLTPKPLLEKSSRLSLLDGRQDNILTREIGEVNEISFFWVGGLTSSGKNFDNNHNHSSQLFLHRNHASSRKEYVWRSKTSLFLYLLDVHGNSIVRREDVNPEWHLQVYHGSFSLLSKKYSAMAKLLETQSLLQWLLHQNPSKTRSSWKRIILGSSSLMWRYVWKWIISEETKEIQIIQVDQGCNCFSHRWD